MLCPFCNLRRAFFCSELPEKKSLAKNSEGLLMPGNRAPDGKNAGCPRSAGKRVWLPMRGCELVKRDGVAIGRGCANRSSDRTAGEKDVFAVSV